MYACIHPHILGARYLDIWIGLRLNQWIEATNIRVLGRLDALISRPRNGRYSVAGVTRRLSGPLGDYSGVLAPDYRSVSVHTEFWPKTLVR